MTRIAAHLVPVEIAILGLVEMALSFLLICAVLAAPQAVDVHALASLAMSPEVVRLAAILALVIAGAAVTIGLYRPDVCLHPRRLVGTASVAGMLAFPPVLLIATSRHGHLAWAEVDWLARVLGVWFVGLALTRLIFSLVTRNGRLTRRVLIVGPDDRAKRLRDTVLRSCPDLLVPELATDVRHPANVVGPSHHSIWGVVIVGPASAPHRPTARQSDLPSVRTFSEAEFFERHLGQIELETFEGSPAPGHATHSRQASDGVKRLVDIAVAAGLLVLTLPVMVITAVLIRIDSPGPVFYTQQRTGLNGRPFLLFKFRSMVANAESSGSPVWARHRDSRVTRVGTVIRSTRIDELPQLINVLMGSMSMVGPRPERPMFVEQLRRAIPFYDWRTEVKPGLTGWAQVNYPYGASVEDARQKLAFDLYYVRNRSLFLDLIILLRTVRVVLFREGAR